ncbi:17721_t:CDS:2, partial [Gigaspora rosea]
MDMLNENFFLESFISYINTSKPSLPRLEEFLYHTQDISKNGIRSCHKKLAHKTFFTQIQIISSLSKQSADIKCQYEYASYLDKKQLRSIKENAQNSCVLYFWADVARREEDDKSSDNVQNLMNFAFGRFLLELKSCDDLVQLKDFKKLVNNMIEEHRVVIIQRTQEAQKNKIIQKWKDIARISSLFSSNSFDIFEEKFMQKNLLDSFYCMIIDLFHDSELWRNVLGTNFTQFKISKFELLNLKDISEINNSVKDSFENFNLQSINELQNPDISISGVRRIT